MSYYGSYYGGLGYGFGGLGCGFGGLGYGFGGLGYGCGCGCGFSPNFGRFRYCCYRPCCFGRYWGWGF